MIIIFESEISHVRLLKFKIEPLNDKTSNDEYQNIMRIGLFVCCVQ